MLCVCVCICVFHFIVFRFFYDAFQPPMRERDSARERERDGERTTQNSNNCNRSLRRTAQSHKMPLPFVHIQRDICILDTYECTYGLRGGLPDWLTTQPSPAQSRVLCVLRLSQTIRIVGPVFLSPPLPSRPMPNDSYWCHKLGDLRVCLPVRLPVLGLYIVFHCCSLLGGDDRPRATGKCCVNNAKENLSLKMKT